MMKSLRIKFILKALQILILMAPAVVGIVPDRFWFFYIPFIFIVCGFPPALSKKITDEQRLLIVTICITLTLVDMALRLWGGQFIYPRPEDRFMNRWPKFPALSRFDPNVRYKGDVYGDLAGLTGRQAHQERRAVIFDTDQFGFRNFPSDSERPYDLLVVGDSYGVGMNASQDKIWPELMEKQFGRHVYNLSSGGCPWDYLMNIKTEVGRLKIANEPYLIFVIFSGNDLGGLYLSTDLKFENYFSRGRIAYETYRTRSPVRLILKRALYLIKSSRRVPDSVVVKDFINGRPMLFLKGFIENTKLTVPEVENHPNIPKLKGILHEMASIARNHGIKPVVVLAPSKEDVYSWVPSESSPWSADMRDSSFSHSIRDMCAAEGIPFGDAKSYFIEESRRLFESSGKILWWYDDTHWNDEGQALFARWIQEQFLDKVTKP